MLQCVEFVFGYLINGGGDQAHERHGVQDGLAFGLRMNTGEHKNERQGGLWGTWWL